MHNLHAIIGKRSEILGDQAFTGPGCTVDLQFGMVMVPVNNEFYEAKCGEQSPLVIETFEFLTPAFMDCLREASRGRTLAYCETDYFGGSGGQGAVVWRNGDCVFGPRFGEDDHINQALAFLDIAPSPGKDLFQTLSLGDYRSTADWIRARDV